jgi:hypothetical protein
MRLVAGLLFLCVAAAAHAQSLEGVLSPGKVIAGHAKWELACEACHKKFDKAAQDGLCMDCHKEVGADVREKRGHHGRMKKRDACRSCHTDHKGAQAKIVELDEKSFDHGQTDYPLREGHLKPKCADCHKPKAKYREAPSACVACHKKDDDAKGHKGKLGDKCQDCHAERSWKEAKFDHDKTDFALKGKHAEPAVKCRDCHVNDKYKDTPRNCFACHKKDDYEKKGAHKGRFGEKCETCHSEKDWKTTHFNHDKDTKYSLRGKHRETKCDACHKAPLYKEKTPSECYACHKQDDDKKGHKGELGRKCESCHTEKNWKEAPRFDHDKTDFPLKGRHADAKVKCQDCHESERYKEAPKACVGCHKKDDFENKGAHKGRFGEKCENCHSEKEWKSAHFNHDKDTKYPLRDKHANAKCDACHKGVLYKDKTASDCHACHRADDDKKGHKGTLGKNCESCHTEKDWKEATRFDHNRTRYPLVGKHSKVECKKCHASLDYKEAPRECNGCHEKDDVHKRRLGPQCESCHSARDWRIWDFNHDKTRFKLDGKHRDLGCLVCHSTPVPKKISLPLTCAGCHAQDDVHSGGFGQVCERCHGTRNWKEIRAGSGTKGS